MPKKENVRAELTSTVAVRHLPEQSDAATGMHAFAYTITITNTGDVTAQLIGRHWLITDSSGQTEEVRGLAVVGHQPLLKPGENLRVHQLDPPRDAPRHDARHLLLHDRSGPYPFEAPVPEFGLTLASALH